MTSYTIKYSDQLGDWWFNRRGRWSDDAADALRFTDEAEAEREAAAAKDRLNANRPEGHAQARVRVIKSL